MRPTFHYDPWTCFLEWQSDNFWSHAEWVDLPLRQVIQAENRHLKQLKDLYGRADELVNLRGMPFFRLNDGSMTPYPVAGGEDFPSSPTLAWTPFGMQFPYTGAAADNGSLTGTMAAQYQQYRDVILSGTLTATASPQVMVARQVNMAGNTVSAGALGGAGGAGGVTAAGAAGHGSLFNIACTVVIAPTAAVPYDNAENLFALGGQNGAGLANAGLTGASYSAGNIFVALSLEYLAMGVTGGGGGGGGSGGVATGTQVAAGRRGGNGSTGSTTGSGGSGGSGIGGGAGGGNGNTTGGTGGTGGAGGGALLVVCEDIVGTAGTFAANGVTGSNAAGTNAGGGGGGGGGFVLIFARHVTTTPTVTATGGAKGNKVGTGGDGGVGGAGFAFLQRSI